MPKPRLLAPPENADENMSSASPQRRNGINEGQILHDYKKKSEENSSKISLKVVILKEGFLTVQQSQPGAVGHALGDTQSTGRDQKIYLALSSFDLRAYKTKKEYEADGKVIFQVKLSQLYPVEPVLNGFLLKMKDDQTFFAPLTPTSTNSYMNLSEMSSEMNQPHGLATRTQKLQLDQLSEKNGAFAANSTAQQQLNFKLNLLPTSIEFEARKDQLQRVKNIVKDLKNNKFSIMLMTLSKIDKDQWIKCLNDYIGI